MMEKTFSLPACSRIPSSIYSHPIRLITQPANLNSWNNNNNSSSFHKIKEGQKLVLALQATSYNESSIAQPGPGPGLGQGQGQDNLPLSMELEPISDESQFDRVVAEAQHLEESIVILWVASWCRKCIYLKPKLEKLATDYYPRIRFYSVDVNNVPHKLVVRAGVTKMPTIQLWRDGEKQAEVIGGHKAYLVVNEVREMIENENGNL